MRTLFLLVLAVTETIVGFSQTQPSFEVVSVRPCQPNDPRGSLRPESGGTRYVGRCVALRGVLWTVYSLNSDQVVGGPNWIDNDRFYIEGVAPRPSSVDELHTMMQQLVAERFNLRFHREKKEVDAYVLTMEKGGPKNLREHPATNATEIAIDQKIEQRGERIFHEVWTVRSSSMEFFAWRLASRLGRPVVDQTGLRAGGYDFDLSFTNLPPRDITAAVPDPAVGLPNPTLPNSSEPDMFEAFRDQLGLKLDRRRAAVDVLVIDHVERPSVN
jgi:uncharacterized protein (TIGR03435 family)